MTDPTDPIDPTDPAGSAAAASARAAADLAAAQHAIAEARDTLRSALEHDDELLAAEAATHPDSVHVVRDMQEVEDLAERGEPHEGTEHNR